MGCNCKGTTKGIANRAQERWLVQDIYNQYVDIIGDKSIQYFTTEQRQQVRYWYYQAYPNSVEVDYKKADYELNKLFDYHKLR